MKDKTHIELDDFNTKIYNNLVPQVDKVFRHCRQGSIKTRYRCRDGMYHFCKFLAMAYRKQNLNSIKPKHLEGYVEQMKESGYSKSYMTTNLSAVRFFIDQKGGDSKKYPTNREMGVDFRTKLDRIGNNKAWSESEFISFIEYAESVGEYSFADMARVAYSFGLRIHEVTRLDHNHLKEALKTVGLSVTGKGGLRRTVMVSNNKALIERLYNDSKVAVYPDIINRIISMLPDGLTPMFGLEDVGGNGRSLAVYLSKNDFIVKEVNPVYSSSERKNNPTTMKNDEWDAKCIGDVLIKKMNELPDFVPNDLYWTIRQCVYRRDGYVKQQAITKIQLQEQLVKTYPSYRNMFSKVAGQTALAFWEKYPSQHLVLKEDKDDLHKFLLKASDNHCSIKKVNKILELVESDGDTYRNHQETRDILVRTYVTSLSFLKKEIEQLEKVIESLIGQLDYKLTTLTGCGVVMAAQLIAEIGDIDRFKNANKLARYAGVAPMKHSSAGKGIEKKARQGNRRLNTIFYFLALQQVQLVKGTKKPRNEVFFEYYERKISEGKTKTQALICVQRRLVNIVYGMMKYKTAYDMSYSSLNKAS